MRWSETSLRRMWRLVPRTLIFLMALCLVTTMFVFRCGVDIEEGGSHGKHGRSLSDKKGHGGIGEKLIDKEESELLRAKEEECQKLKKKILEYEREIERLKQEVKNVESQLSEARKFSDDVVNKNGDSEALKHKETAVYLKNHFDQKFRESEILSGVSFNNEYELFAFCRFTITRIYLVDPGLGKRVVEKPIGYKKKEILEVVNYGVEKLNENRASKTHYSPEDFIEGIYRTEATMGTHYELYFRDLDHKSSLHYRKLLYSRPYGPLHLMASINEATDSQVINIILPLKGRLDKFKSFMERFGRVCVKHDKRIVLTIVYFGNEGFDEVTMVTEKIKKQYNFHLITLMSLNEPFSRGRGLQVGSQSWTKGDVLLFFCDVDVVFSTDFLERCRLNAKKGKRVYYPIVFSLYNPSVVYSLQDVPIPAEHEQLVISKDTGFWRDFGYGMTCQYQSDFNKSGGFDEQIHGWGLEDVHLYKKYVKSTYLVVRATDPGIFHLWHEKVCDPNTPPDQYRGCIRSKALNEASHSQLGMLAYKEEVELHKNLLKKKKKKS